MLKKTALIAFLAVMGVPLHARAEPTDPPPAEEQKPAEPPPPPPDAPANGGTTQIQAGGPVIVHAEGPVTIVQTPGATPNPPQNMPPIARTPGVGVVPAATEPEPVVSSIDPDRDAPYPKRRHFVFQLGAGASVYSFHSDAIYMGGAFIGFGADTKAGSFDGIISAEGGRTEQGLHTWRVDYGAQLSWLAGPLRIGFGPRVGLFDVDRITSSSSFLYFTVGLEGLLGVDLYRGQGVEVSLSIRPKVIYAAYSGFLTPGDEAGLLGATASLEFRARSPRKPVHKGAAPVTR